MAAFMTPLSILQDLAHRPSRSSAATIGRWYVLNGAPPGVRIQDLQALGGMACDWTAGILEAAVRYPERGIRVRRQAIATIQNLLNRACRRGFARVTSRACDELEAQASLGIRGEVTAATDLASQAATMLCGYLRAAI